MFDVCDDLPGLVAELGVASHDIAETADVGADAVRVQEQVADEDSRAPCTPPTSSLHLCLI